jgi:hypothetical protein
MTAGELLSKALVDVAAIVDPVERERQARLLGQRIAGWQETLRLVRSDAIRELRGDGLSLAALSVELDLSTAVLRRLIDHDDPWSSDAA